MSNLKISILMCVYNEELFIDDAIKSVLGQSYDNFELIIVDDGSNDNTSQIIQNYLNDNRVFLYSPGRIGKIKANNLAFKKSTGDFLCFFSGDDLMTKESIKERLSTIVSIVDKPAISFCRLKTLSKQKKYNEMILPRNKNKGNLTSGCQMFNRKFANLSFPIPDFLGNEDMWQVQYAHFYPGIVVKQSAYIGLRYRIHINNSSNKMDTFSKKSESMNKRFIVYKIFLDKNKHMLSKESVKRLQSLSKSEDLRYTQKSLSILFLNNLTLNEKIRFIVYSNKYLYSIRSKLFSLFSGWAL